MTDLLHDVLETQRRLHASTGKVPLAVRCHPAVKDRLAQTVAPASPWELWFGLEFFVTPRCPRDTVYIAYDWDTVRRWRQEAGWIGGN